MTDRELLGAAAKASGSAGSAGWAGVPVTEVRQYSEYGKFSVGDYVTRDGSDVQLVKDLTDDGYCGTFVCVVAPSSGWCAVGEDEFNLCRRYSRVNYRPIDAARSKT